MARWWLEVTVGVVACVLTLVCAWLVVFSQNSQTPRIVDAAPQYTDTAVPGPSPSAERLALSKWTATARGTVPVAAPVTATALSIRARAPLTVTPIERSAHTAVPSATRMPSPPIALAALPDTAELQALIATTESALRSGQFDAIMYTNDTATTSSRLLVELGEGERAPRLMLTSIYTGAAEVAISEHLYAEDQQWRRDPNGIWIEEAIPSDPQSVLGAYLPHIATATNLWAERKDDAIVVRWTMNEGAVEKQLSVDPHSWTPRLFSVRHLPTQSVLTVRYTRWNEAVEIPLPES